MDARRGLIALAVACLAALAVAGCTAGATPPRAATAGTASSAEASHPATPQPSWRPPDGEVTAFQARAKQVASSWPSSPLGKVWQTALVIPSTADLTFVGDGRGYPSEGVKDALGNGNLVYAGPPPSRYGPEAVVRWPDAPGRQKMPVPVLSEAQTFSALKNNGLGRCPGCHTTPLAVTAAQPNSLLLPTSQGDALVPAWSFTILALGGQVTQAALPPGSYITENSAAGPAENLPPAGQGFVGANLASVQSDDGRTLGMWLASDPCRPPAKWGGLVAEVGDEVVVGGWIQDPRPIANCVPGAYGRYVQVRLAAPLGRRLILDADTGLPAFDPFHPAPAAAS